MPEIEVHFGVTVQAGKDTMEYGRFDALMRTDVKGKTKKAREEEWERAWQEVVEQVGEAVAEFQEAVAKKKKPKRK